MRLFINAFCAFINRITCARVSSPKLNVLCALRERASLSRQVHSTRVVCAFGGFIVPQSRPATPHRQYVRICANKYTCRHKYVTYTYIISKIYLLHIYIYILYIDAHADTMPVYYSLDLHAQVLCAEHLVPVCLRECVFSMETSAFNLVFYDL